MPDKKYVLPGNRSYLVRRTPSGTYEVQGPGEKSFTEAGTALPGRFRIENVRGKRILAWPGGSLELDALEYGEGSGSGGGKLQPLKLTMPGKVLSVKVKEGEKVTLGQGLVVVEAMKMENLLLAPAAAKIGKIHVQEGDRLESGALLITFEAPDA